MTARGLLVWVCCLWTVHLAWTQSVDVIKIQRGGSQVRTIYLPRPEPATNQSADSLVLVSQSEPGGTQRHRSKTIAFQPQFVRKPLANSVGRKGEISKARNDSSTEVVKDVIKKRKQHLQEEEPPFLGLSIRAPGVEIRTGADKVAKLLNLFTIVNFTNEVCYTEEGLAGTCYHAAECEAFAGQPRGLCAQGFGVCCYVERSCGERSGLNNTYVTARNMGKDTHTGVYICSILIDKTSQDISQLLLSFHSFQLAGPVKGNCVVDRFVVTGQNRNNIIPPLCGFNTGKQVYVDVDEVEGPVTLTLMSSGAHGVPQPRDWTVQVTQLRQCHPRLAPHNCLQYFTQPQGIVESFNYISRNMTSPSSPGYFNDLNYAVCFKKLPGYCGIVFNNMASGGMEYTFEIVNSECDGTGTVPEGQAGAEGFDCPDDYIVIGGTRLCGYKLNDGSHLVDYSKNSPVIDDSSGPLILKFHTNKNLTGRGFRLQYMLTTCTPSVHETTTATALPPAATRSSFTLA